MYIDKLDDTVNKYYDASHRTIKMKLIDVKTSTYTDFDDNNDKILNLKLVIMKEYPNGYTPY